MPLSAAVSARVALTFSTLPAEVVLPAADAIHLACTADASFTPTPHNVAQMRGFFTSIARGDLKLLWEPRGNWPRSLVLSLCSELELSHVVDPFLSRSVTRDFIYLRLHGGKDFKHVFSGEALQKVAGLIQSGKPAYVMFNNVNMWDDARRFQLLMGG